MAFLPTKSPMVEQGGFVSMSWLGFFQELIRGTKAAAGNNVFAVADQPTLTASDEGFVGYVSDYGHTVRWDGTVWRFAPGDVGNAFFRSCPVAPQDSAFWGLCDGSIYNYLVLATTLTTAAFTTPNLSGTPTYLRSGAYTGTITANGGASGVNLSTLACPVYFRI